LILTVKCANEVIRTNKRVPGDMDDTPAHTASDSNKIFLSGGVQAESVATASGGLSLLRVGAVFLALLAGALVFQWLGGAFSGDFSQNSDEAAHYVTGLMVHDYLRAFPWPAPMPFARAFYDEYPKVALGHWPPFFYVVEAGWMLVFSPSRASMVTFIAAIDAGLALTLFLCLRHRTGNLIAAAAAAGLECLPLLQVFEHRVMPELLSALLLLCAALCFARFLRTERVGDSLGFGVVAALAIMTKPNGLALALLPPFAIIAANRLALAKRFSFWAPGLVVAVVCGPWYVAALPLMENGAPSFTSIGSAASHFGPHYGTALLAITGWALNPLAALGFLDAIVLPWPRRRVGADAAALAGLLASVLVFHIFIVPLGELRHMLPAAVAVVAFAAIGMRRCVAVLEASGVPGRAAFGMVISLTAIAFALVTFAVPQEANSGAADVAETILAHPEWRHDVVLVSSQGNGESAIIAEIAMREGRPGHRVLRASKVLSTSGWDGSGYRLLFSTSEAAMAYLDTIPVGIIVIDTIPRPDKPRDEHTLMLSSFLEHDRTDWRPVSLPPPLDSVEHYQVFHRASDPRGKVAN
jgi:4-amino-4-deoxy-L-arabinose transferase-like glycosyltransferase